MNAPETLPAALLPSHPDGAAIREAYLADERTTLAALAAQAVDGGRDRRAGRARRRAPGSRACARSSGHAGIESFLQQYDLSTQEGVLLMCVAEALLRIPDAGTADRADPRQARRAATGSGISARPTRCWSTRRRGA